MGSPALPGLPTASWVQPGREAGPEQKTGTEGLVPLLPPGLDTQDRHLLETRVSETSLRVQYLDNQVFTLEAISASETEPAPEAQEQ